MREPTQERYGELATMISLSVLTLSRWLILSQQTTENFSRLLSVKNALTLDYFPLRTSSKN